MGLPQIIQHDRSFRDVLKNDERIYEIKIVVREYGEIGAGSDMHLRGGAIPQSLTGERNHLVRYVYAVNFAEVARHGKHQPAGSTTYFKTPPNTASGRRQTDQFTLDRRDDFGGRGPKILFGLFRGGERDIKMRVCSGPGIPIGPHPI